LDHRPGDALMLRPIGALRIAAEAEGLRLKSQASRIVSRMVMGVIALVFLLVALAFAHVAVWYWLRLSYSWAQYWTACAIGGGDIILAAALGLMAARSSPSRVEREARDVRQRAIAGLGTTVAASTLVVPVIRVVGDMMRRRR
jgi:hypothetical protein